MNTSRTGRNAPCPCGSGKKFKHCCLGRENATPFGHGAPAPSQALREALQGQEFHSQEEAQAFANEHMRQQNQRPLDDFDGLSPDQMAGMLNRPFSSQRLVVFPEVLDSPPSAPITRLFSLLVEAIGEQGLKPTAKGNLPRQFCREAALAYWGEQKYQKNTRFGDINREVDFSDLHVTRLVAELAGLVRTYKGKFILSRECRHLLAGGGLAAVYPKLSRAYVEQFNWPTRMALWRYRSPRRRFCSPCICSGAMVMPRGHIG
jgi:hypothetical protein